VPIFPSLGNDWPGRKPLDKLAVENRIVPIMIRRAGREAVLVAKLLLVVAASRAVACCAQTSEPATAVPTLVGSAIAVPPTFEVSTVKQNKSGSSSSSSNFHGGRFTAVNVLLKNILQYQAYGIPESRILGSPKWLNSERFDIEAKTDSAATDRLRTLARDQRRIQTQAMFQQLLADRFKLAVHRETKDLPVYALVVAKKGPNLPPSKEPDGHSGTSSNDGQFTAQGVTMPQIADALTQELSRELGRVVIDKTGIQGRFDVALKWMPGTGPALVNDGTEAPSDSGPSIFTAIQEQLGLKFESTKGPVQVLVIDHVEMPSEN
jgi:uncharacterized protein (TIGR03435 family)